MPLVGTAGALFDVNRGLALERPNDHRERNRVVRPGQSAPVIHSLAQDQVRAPRAPRESLQALILDGAYNKRGHQVAIDAVCGKTFTASGRAPSGRITVNDPPR